LSSNIIFSGENTILEPYIDGGFKVKDEVNFHLYINTAPCGDARLFSPHESSGKLIATAQ